MLWQYTYGPVPSRRLGHSLGVSVIPSKVCSYSCVYCQLGRTSKRQIRRESFFPREAVLREIAQRLKTRSADYITFAGDGEPTLSKDLGWLIAECKARWDTPVAVITNGSLLFQEDLREELQAADVVLPSLDAGNQTEFLTINRPFRELKFDKVIEGLRLFSAEYRGRLWLEVMLVEGANDMSRSLEDIRDRLKEIRPDRVYVMIPTRPPCEKWVKPPPVQRILEAQRILGEVTPLMDRETGLFGLDGYADVDQAVLDIGSRHPMRSSQAELIEKSFGAVGRVAQLVKKGILQYVDYDSVQYVVPRHLLGGGK